jgi:hypothetical protein
MGKSNAYRAIFWGGLVAGTLDITAAFVNSGLRGVGPERVLRGIASGWLGTGAAQGGIAAAALGLLSHFLIATTATAVYYFASRKLKFLVQQPALYGPVYAVAVYLFMNFIVLPLSAFPYKITYTFSTVATGVLILIFCIGLPIAYIVRAHSK